VNDLGSTEGIVALAAAGVAVVALLLAIFLAFKLRRLRASQQVVLGSGGQRDLVAHSERLETGFVELRDWVEEVLRKLDDRVGHAEQRIDGCLASSILHREQARVYVKRVVDGHSELDLSPEEIEAIDAAFSAKAGA
jgi:uncharacterized membrane protein YecN with MAPEG domain